MAIKFIDDTYLTAIANAIRSKLGGSATYKPSEMATAIGSITGGITPTGTISITQNGTVDVTQYASASVSVSDGWVDVTPSLAVLTKGTNCNYSYDSTNDELRVWSTSNGTYRSCYINDFVVESDTIYRAEFQLINNKSGVATVMGFANPNGGNIVCSSGTATASAFYMFGAKLSERSNYVSPIRIGFYCTWSTSAAGDAIWKNFRLYKYTGS